MSHTVNNHFFFYFFLEKCGLFKCGGGRGANLIVLDKSNQFKAVADRSFIFCTSTKNSVINASWEP